MNEKFIVRVAKFCFKRKAKLNHVIGVFLFFQRHLQHICTKSNSNVRVILLPPSMSLGLGGGGGGIFFILLNFFGDLVSVQHQSGY